MNAFLTTVFVIACVLAAGAALAVARSWIAPRPGELVIILTVYTALAVIGIAAAIASGPHRQQQHPYPQPIPAPEGTPR